MFPKLFLLLSILISLSYGKFVSQNLIILTNENFDAQIENSNVFVGFINDFEKYENVIELLEQIKDASSGAGVDMATKNLKFAILDCKDNKEKCDEHGVEQNLALRFFGNIEKWKAVAVYLDTTMEEVLQEDVLLEKLEEIGSFLIIFTVPYCQYCKETLIEWEQVTANFKKSPSLQTGTIDCLRHGAVCKKYGVDKYPRIHFIINRNVGSQEVFKFQGERTANGIISYANTMIDATNNKPL